MCQQPEPQTITCSPTLAVSFFTYINMHYIYMCVSLNIQILLLHQLYFLVTAQRDS